MRGCASLDIWPAGHSICKAPLRSPCSICAASRHVMARTHWKQYGYKIHSFSICFIQYEWPGLGICLLIRCTFSGRKTLLCKPPGPSYRLPAVRANIVFPEGTYRVCRQANISTKRRSENGNFFTFHFVTGVPVLRRRRPLFEGVENGV